MTNGISVDLGDFNIEEPPINESAFRELPPRVLMHCLTETENDYTLTIDNTSLERFTTCARSAEYYLVKSREKSGHAVALSFGKAIHSALEVRYLYGNSPAVQQRQQEVLMQSFAQNPTPHDDHRTLDRALQIMRAYDKKFPIETFEVLKHPKTGDPMIEVPFTVPLGKVEINDHVLAWSGSDPARHVYNPGDKRPWTYVGTVHIIWSGRIDMLVHEDGYNWVLDNKTTSIMGPQYFREFELSNQTIGYGWAAQRAYGIKIQGFILNAIAVRKPSATGKAQEFERKRYNYSQQQYAEWETNTIYLVSDFLTDLQRGFFPMETKWCFGKYGQCPYHEVCTLPPENRDEALQFDQFKPVTWSPLND